MDLPGQNRVCHVAFVVGSSTSEFSDNCWEACVSIHIGLFQVGLCNNSFVGLVVFFFLLTEIVLGGKGKI